MIQFSAAAVRWLTRTAWSVATLAVMSGGLAAQDWPSRVITAVVPFGPGTSLDTVGRPVFEPMSQQLGQPIVIEHRPGGGGIVGAGAVARAAPDGYTMLLFSSSFVLVSAFYENKPFDALRDFIPVIPFGVQPYVLVAAPSRGFKSVADLIAAAKAKPGSINYASTGAGSAAHIAGERLRLVAGIEAQHVPFRGFAEAMTETLTGRIDFYFLPLGSALANIKDGKLTALAVSTSNRAKDLPDVPTLEESGLKVTPFELWNGLFVPANTPEAVVRKLHSAARAALQTDLVRQRFNALAVEPLDMTQEQFAAYFRKDLEDTVALIKQAKIETPK